MTAEADHVAALRRLATHPAARGLMDDAAVLGDVVLTHDMMVAGVHWLPDADPRDVAWKLLAVNLSDLAAKGAVPLGVLLGSALGEDAAWDAAFAEGLGDALGHYQVPLLGGDTVRMPSGAARAIGMTAIGRASVLPVPSRSGAQPGDGIWVAGRIGDAGAGLAQLQRGKADPPGVIQAHRRPVPLLADGQALASRVHAMMDVSDGLLLDAQRLAGASGVRMIIQLDAMPLSAEFRALRGGDRHARLFAATAGDDYALLFALPAGEPPPVAATQVGRCQAGSGISVLDGETPVDLPDSLGFQH